MKKPLIIRPDQIKEVTGLISRSSAYQLERTDIRFPKRVRIGRVSGWLYTDLERYLEERK
jgi:predicted DNA-binding transcriptional regulator AlpA